MSDKIKKHIDSKRILIYIIATCIFFLLFTPIAESIKMAHDHYDNDQSLSSQK